MAFTLGQVSGWLGTETLPNPETPVTGVAIDSRKIEPGMLFVAYPGDHADGHDFIAQAARAGACGALVREDWVAPQTLPDTFVLFRCQSVLASLQNLARLYRQQFKFPVIAITGTNGKTTTKEMLVAVLRQKKGAQVAQTRGNLNNHLGVPLTLLNWPQSGDFGVLEMGMNHPGEIRELCVIAAPTHGVITNVGEGHLEYMKNLQGVAKAKAELLDALSESGVGFVNGDDINLKPYHQTARETVAFGFDSANAFHGQVVSYDNLGCPLFSVEDQAIALGVPGSHNAMNALAVSAVARWFGYDWSLIRKGLEAFTGYTSRLSVRQQGPVWIIDDTYNANPSSMRTAIQVLASLKPVQRRVAILGDMLELGSSSESAHRNLGELIARSGIEVFIGVGEAMRFAVQAARQSETIQISHFDEQETCLNALPQWVEPGDGILVKGSRGMKMEKVVAAVQRLFEN